MAKTNGKMIANNKKAYHDYFILENYEAGIALHGTEVKSLGMGKCSIKEAFIRVENGEVYIYGMHISPYEKGNIFNKDPLRVRKLLLHKSEINKLLGKTKEKGIAIVPLKVYFKGSLVKVEIGLAGYCQEGPAKGSAEILQGPESGLGGRRWYQEARKN